jgi:hypothetical protein
VKLSYFPWVDVLHHQSFIAAKIVEGVLQSSFLIHWAGESDRWEARCYAEEMHLLSDDRTEYCLGARKHCAAA